MRPGDRDAARRVDRRPGHDLSPRPDRPDGARAPTWRSSAATTPIACCASRRASRCGTRRCRRTWPRSSSAVDQGLRILPLIYQGELLGAIALGAFRSARPDEDELMQAERVAGQVVLALANARMVDQIRFLAYFDSLTGLPNRVSFKRKLTEELERGALHAEAAGRLLPRPRSLQPHQRHPGPPVRRPPGAGGGAPDPAPAAGSTPRGGGGAPGRRRIHRDRARPRRRRRRRASSPAHLLESFNTPFALDGHEVFISASIGIAVFPTDGIGPGEPAEERRPRDVPGEAARAKHRRAVRDLDGDIRPTGD